MKIVCGSCAAKYTVSDEKVQGKSVKVKCRKCGAVIIVAPSGEVRTEGGQPAPTATYTVSVSEVDQRSMSVPEIIAAYNDGTIDADTFVWTEGMDEWAALKDVDVIVDALHAAAHADAGQNLAGQNLAGQNLAGQNGAGGSLDTTMAMAEGAGMASYDAALAQQRADVAPSTGSPFGGGVSSSAASVDYGGSGSLFGAGTPSSPGASLFGGGGGASMFSNISTGATGATGAPGSKPDENSAIFSLNTLTAKASSGPARKASNNEDSGLIDLKALASSVNTGTEIGVAASASPYGDGGLFSIPAPPPPAATVVAAPMAPPQQVVEVAKPANKGLIIGLGIMVVALLGAVVFLALRMTQPVAKTEGPATTGAAQTAVAAAPPPTPIATAVAVAEAPSAEPTATAAAAVPTAAAATPQPKSAAAAPPPKSNGPASPPPPKAAPPPPPPPPKTSTGGCRPDDLMCLMRAGAKKKK